MAGVYMERRDRLSDEGEKVLTHRESVFRPRKLELPAKLHCEIKMSQNGCWCIFNN